jgi:SAM-dependent methyltransferase
MSNVSEQTVLDIEIHDAVQKRYGEIAESFSPEEEPAGSASAACCDSSSLYEINLSDLPADVTQLSLGCGDPVTLASLEPGQTVLDLGSGGGIDCFLAARQVGDTGKVIGIDMTQAMINKAEKNLDKVGLPNVEFRLGKIEELPVDDNSVDVIISNCVINLSPDKAAVFREAFRVLKPGGRLAVSDMVTQGKMPPEQRKDMNAWAACIAGAEDVRDYLGAIKSAGFNEISIMDKDGPEIELTTSVDLYIGPPRIFSARVVATKPNQ